MNCLLYSMPTPMRHGTIADPKVLLAAREDARFRASARVQRSRRAQARTRFARSVTTVRPSLTCTGTLNGSSFGACMNSSVPFELRKSSKKKEPLRRKIFAWRPLIVRYLIGTSHWAEDRPIISGREADESLPPLLLD